MHLVLWCPMYLLATHKMDRMSCERSSCPLPIDLLVEIRNHCIGRCIHLITWSMSNLAHPALSDDVFRTLSLLLVFLSDAFKGQSWSYKTDIRVKSMNPSMSLLKQFPHHHRNDLGGQIIILQLSRTIWCSLICRYLMLGNIFDSDPWLSLNT